MNFIVICLHCLDMRDFHSTQRSTPFLDEFRKKSIFIPMGRAQGHNQQDSLNAEMTGIWTSRYTNSSLSSQSYQPITAATLPKTIIETMQEADYEIATCIGLEHSAAHLGTFAADLTMSNLWLKDNPGRRGQFNQPRVKTLKDWLVHVQNIKTPFYAHIFLRDTHRPWAQKKDLLGLVQPPTLLNFFNRGPQPEWPQVASWARKAALTEPSKFAALRRKGLQMADAVAQQIIEATQHIKDTTFLIYSNHGEVFDHFRYNIKYRDEIVRRANKDTKMVVGTSHGPFPYEVLYANTQMWQIPGKKPRTMRGIGRSIDIPATFLGLAKIKPQSMDGESMLPDFERGFFEDRDRYAEHLRCISMVRKDGFKFLFSPVHPYHQPAVFDLKSDPYEYVNLVHTEIGDEVVAWAVEKHKSLKC